MTTFSTSLIDDLALRVEGPVLSGDDPRIAAEVAAFNTTHTPRPAVVVGATCAADVAAAVRWATERGRRWRCSRPATACCPTSPARS